MSFHVYILTNSTKSVLYVGMTNDLAIRLVEHYNGRGNPKTFTGKYYCYYLLWHEQHHSSVGAIQREKEIKKWRREKKESLNNETNPDWLFLNKEIIPWPPETGIKRW